MRQPQVSYTSVFVFFIFHLFLTRSELEGIKSAGSNFCCNFLCNIFGWNFLVGQNPMDANNWRPTIPGGEPVIDMGYWRIQLQPDSRKRIIDKIMETLKRHLLFSGQEGLQELKKIVVRFEEKIYTASTNQSDYLRKISLEMLSMEIRSQNAMPTAPMDPAASHSMPPEVQNQGLFLPILLSTDHSQARQQLVSQNMQNCMASNGVQSYAGLQAALPPVSGVTLTIPNTVVQNPNMQSIPGIQWDKGFPTLCLPILRDKCQIKVMKETYFPEINEMHQRIAARLQQLDSLPHQPNSEQLEKLEIFKTMLERLITFLQVSKNNITPSFKEKLGPMRSRL
ncbi:PREDICTED: mediator of RNA polymerase II transcription subunit 15a-like isoform X1 [Populus euphratica]|uniref:Mediator of RNA polymerase II transcription subunit 15a-like isoform X1 n=1 Tax=Populus euphratica TaxID=75702 RepID=A0AAJ6X8X8_POPEU|nr:PREDICTED: mediator of RNA polymerase II transcription subunit 15a-like isoform X1 [Populus euphratica]